MKQEIIHSILRYHTGRCDKKEKLELEEWLKECEENKRFFDEISDIWYSSAIHNPINRYNSKKAFSIIKERVLDNSETKKNTPVEKTKTLTRFLKYAAAIIISFSLGGMSIYFLSSSKIKQLSYTTIKAPMGSKTEVVLPDSSKIWLNAGSVISYSNAFNNKNRAVTLSGEGYFDIHRNKKIPFTVDVENLKIKVLGTKFNLKAYPDEGLIQTTLVEGSLIVINEANRGGRSETRLLPNQKITYMKHSGKVFLSAMETKSIKKLELEDLKGKLLLNKKVEVAPITAWKDNKLVFRNESFESLARKLERWFDVKIAFGEEEIKNYHFNGIIENETINEVLEIIKYTLPIEFTIEHNQINIYKNEKADKK